MFWRHDGKVSVQYLLWGVVAAGVLALAGWFFLVRYEPAPNTVTDVSPTPDIQAETANDRAPGQTVPERYVERLAELRAEVEKSESAEAAIAAAETAFFSVRVPQPLLDTHLSALLKIRKLKGVKDAAGIKKTIITLIDGLLQKAKTL